VDEAAAMTEAVVNLIVSVPVLVSSKDLIVSDSNLVSNGPVVDGSSVASLNGMEVRVLDNVGDGTIPSLSAATYKLLVGGTSDCGSGTVLLPDGIDVNLGSSEISSAVENEAPTSSSLSVVTLPPPSSCSSLLLLGEVADGQLPATAVV